MVVLASGEAPGTRSLDDCSPGIAASCCPRLTHRDDMAFWLYSCGSTGRPKGVVHLHHDIPYTCETYARQILRHPRGRRHVLRPSSTTPTDSGNNLTFPFWAGATTVLLPGRPTPEGSAGDRRSAPADARSSGPDALQRDPQRPDASEHDLSRCRFCVSAAEPLAPEVWRRWQRRFGLDDPRRHRLDRDAAHLLLQPPGACGPGSSGKPVPGYELRAARRATASRSPTGEVGNLYVQGRQRARRSTGASRRRPSGRSAASGSPPATATASTPTASTGTRAAPTT